MVCVHVCVYGVHVVCVYVCAMCVCAFVCMCVCCLMALLFNAHYLRVGVLAIAMAHFISPLDINQ